MSWNVTRRCHLACPHCYIDASARSQEDELPTSEALRVIDAIAGMGRPLLILSGGEPLLRPDLDDLVRHARDRGLPVALGTSGLLLTPERAAVLREAGVRAAAISLDAADPAAHDAFRGHPGAFEAAVNGIRACREAGMKVQVNVTVTPENYDGIEPLLDFAADLGVATFQVFFLVPTGRGQALTDVTPAEYEALIRRVLLRVADRPVSVRPTCAPLFMRIAEEMGLEVRGWQRGCLAGTAYCRIAPNGDLTPCPYLPLRVGSLPADSFADLWNHSPIFAALRDPDRLGGACASCTFRVRCGGCRARAYGLSGDYLGSDPWCTHRPSGPAGGAA